MKILRFDPSEKSPQLFTLNINFDKSSGILSGSVGTEGFGDTDLIREFRIDLNLWRGHIVTVALGTTNIGYEVSVFDALKNYSMGNGMPERPHYRGPHTMNLFRISVHENIDESLIQIRQGHGEIQGFENIIQQGDVVSAMLNLIEHDEVAAELVAVARLKSDMLGKIDQRDSVAYLEAQVDVLTRLFIQLHPELKGDLIEILRCADERSVLNMKNKARLLKEFEHKADVRKVQADFYERKAALA